MRNKSKREIGLEAERLAGEHLVHSGYQIRNRNWRCRSGELDLVAEHNGVLVIVEVRSRTQSGRFGTPEEAIHPRKQQQVRETAQVYLFRHQLYEMRIRFDAVTVLFDREGNCARIRHIENAF